MFSIHEGVSIKPKGTSRVAWMGDEEIKMLQAIAAGADLPQTQILSRIVAAGLRCIAANGNRLELPLQFHMGQSPRILLNETERPGKTSYQRK